MVLPLPFLAAPKSDEGGIKGEGRPALRSAFPTAEVLLTKAVDEGGGEGLVLLRARFMAEVFFAL
jgi:hypothetical protein